MERSGLHLIAPTIGIAPEWFRYWFGGFHPDGASNPYERQVRKAGSRVEWRGADGQRHTGTLHGEPPPPERPFTFFDTVVRDEDRLMELVPATRIRAEGDAGRPCSRCQGMPPAGFTCNTCGVSV